MRETVKKFKKQNVPKIIFNATTPEEKNYIERLNKLLEKKRRGDWGLVAQILGVLPGSAEKSFLRVYSKNHFEAVEALEKVINNRNNLLNQSS